MCRFKVHNYVFKSHEFRKSETPILLHSLFHESISENLHFQHTLKYKLPIKNCKQNLKSCDYIYGKIITFILNMHYSIKYMCCNFSNYINFIIFFIAPNGSIILYAHAMILRIQQHWETDARTPRLRICRLKTGEVSKNVETPFVRLMYS